MIAESFLDVLELATDPLSTHPLGISALQRRSLTPPLSNDERKALAELENSLSKGRDSYLAELRNTGQKVLDERVFRGLYRNYVGEEQMLVARALESVPVPSLGLMPAIRSMRVTSEREMLLQQTGLLFDAERGDFERKHAELQRDRKRPKQPIGYQQLVNDYHSGIMKIYVEAQLRLASFALAQSESADQVAVHIYLLRKGIKKPSALVTSQQTMDVKGVPEP